jgi:hypothetical protein
MDSMDEEYWNPLNFYENAEINAKKVENSINDLKFNFEKIMVCGKAVDQHPKFQPRFSTSSTDIDSKLYVLVDHTFFQKKSIKRNGKYALSIIVHPLVVQKIENIGGEIFWFSPEYLKNDLPKIVSGKFPRENSGLATISLASYFGAKKILLSGIKFDDKKYKQFLDGKEIVFSKIKNEGKEIFSLDGVLAKKITFTKWCKN